LGRRWNASVWRTALKNRINLDLNDSEGTALVFKALSSPVRLQILRVLVDRPGMNISELAECFTLPLSTAALHVRVMEEAGLIFIQEKPGLRGAQKVCALQAEDVYLNIYHREKDVPPTRDLTYSMPLGNYFDCAITRPCGIAGQRSYIGIEDSANAFYSPERVNAQLVWFTSGFLEYRFPNYFVKDNSLRALRFSFEACSEAAGYNNDWPSDITLWVNHHEVYTFRSAGDYGGKRGLLNPEWWPDASSQYGELRVLEINAQGCFGDGRKSSDLSLKGLDLITDREYISLKIGVKTNSECVGGINIFGEHFGNYPQNIEMTAKLEW
jgi:predicted transcriptional regulator